MTLKSLLDHRLLPLLLVTALGWHIAPMSMADPGEKAPSEAPSEEPSEEPREEVEEGEREATEEPLSNKIRWTTASEVDNFGFDVYRSESEDGPFEVLTKEPIEGGGTVDEPRNYLFVDDTIDPAKAYYYYVESVAMSGEREQFTPIVRAKPKKPQSEE